MEQRKLNFMWINFVGEKQHNSKAVYQYEEIQEDKEEFKHTSDVRRNEVKKPAKK